jgi:hypothetical protein
VHPLLQPGADRAARASDPLPVEGQVAEQNQPPSGTLCHRPGYGMLHTNQVLQCRASH